MRPRLEDLETLTAGIASHRRPAAAPDGAWIAHEVHLDVGPGVGRAGEIVVTDRRGRFARAVGGPGVLCDPAFLSPGLLAFCEATGDRFAVMTLDLSSGKRTVRVEHPSASLRWPTCSLPRARLAFTGEVARGQGEALLEVELQGVDGASSGAIEKLTERTGQVERRPAYAPSGHLVAFEVFASAAATDCALAVFDVRRRRTEIVAFEPGVRFASPCFVDDRRIVFERAAADGRRELALLEVATKRLAPIGTGSSVSLGMPAAEPALFLDPKDRATWVVFAGQPSTASTREDPRKPYEILCGRLAGL